MIDNKTRCKWSTNASIEEIVYHDTEWGTPSKNDAHLFEMLILEGAQAGLSWVTILKKRNGYRAAFDNFDVLKIALYSNEKKEELRHNSLIVRNRLKIEAAVINANCFLAIQHEFGTFSDYIWQFVDGHSVQNRWECQEEVPTSTPESDAMSTDMKKRGFKFVGTTICYAYMQAVGMVNDHTTDCFRYIHSAKR